MKPPFPPILSWSPIVAVAFARCPMDGCIQPSEAILFREMVRRFLPVVGDIQRYLRTSGQAWLLIFSAISGNNFGLALP